MLICNIYTHILTHTYSHIAFVMFEREVKSIHIFELTVFLPRLHITSNIYNTVIIHMLRTYSVFCVLQLYMCWM